MTSRQTPTILADAHLAAIIDSSFDAIISKDLNSVITSWNGAAERLFGYTAEEAIGRSILMLIPLHLQSEETEIIRRIRQGERIESYETTRLRKNGSFVSVSLTVSPIKGADGVIVGASKIARDITAAKENERRIRLLMREVNHRVKNQFAVILSMIRETAKHSKDPMEFERRVRERIMALSRSHDLLVNTEWSGADVAELIREHLRPFGHGERIFLNGPLLRLQSNAVQNLGMAFHELGTNSSKYGALSASTGRIEISWSLAAGEAGNAFSLTWRESGIGPEAQSETDYSRRGFGSVVLRRVAPQALGGSAELERAGGDLVWSITVPAENVTSETEAIGH